MTGGGISMAVEKSIMNDKKWVRLLEDLSY